MAYTMAQAQGLGLPMTGAADYGRAQQQTTTIQPQVQQASQQNQVQTQLQKQPMVPPPQQPITTHIMPVPYTPTKGTPTFVEQPVRKPDASIMPISSKGTPTFGAPSIPTERMFIPTYITDTTGRGVGGYVQTTQTPSKAQMTGTTQVARALGIAEMPAKSAIGNRDWLGLQPEYSNSQKVAPRTVVGNLLGITEANLPDYEKPSKQSGLWAPAPGQKNVIQEANEYAASRRNEANRESVGAISALPYMSQKIYPRTVVGNMLGITDANYPAKEQERLRATGDYAGLAAPNPKVTQMQKDWIKTANPIVQAMQPPKMTLQAPAMNSGLAAMKG